MPPRQQVRSKLLSLDAPTGSDMAETRELKPVVYLERALLAPEHTDQKVSVVNTTEAPSVLKSGTWLGNLCPVEVVSCPEQLEQAP